jgi:hypothetical protein
VTARWSTQNLAGSDGDLIATLEDLIGTNDGTAAGSARATLKTGANGLNGYPVLRFDGVANAYDLTSFIAQTNTWSIVCAIKRIGTEASPISNDSFVPSLVRTTTDIVVSDQTGYALCANAATGWEILAASCNNGSRLLYRNGVAVTVGANVVFVSLAPFRYIGKRQSAGEYSSMDLADSVLYAGTALSAADLLAASAHVNATWGGVY